MPDSEAPWARPAQSTQGNGRRYTRRGTNPDGSTWVEVYEETSSATSTPNSAPFPAPQGHHPSQGSFPPSSGSSDAFWEQSNAMMQQMLRWMEGSRSGPRPAQPRSQPKPQAHAQLDLSLDEAYTGGDHQVKLEGRELILHVPAGIQDGTLVRLKRPEGVAHIRVRVRPDPRFGRRGRDLSTVARVAPSVLEQGGSATIALAGGGFIQIRIPAGTQAGACLRVKGQGMPDVRGGDRGDLYVYVRTAS